ncbi:MAG: aspartate ammonia-lyase, partial [Anaerococcus hydrogenalis]|nr:aspartate ammonia-lyase [Anaerococcus hydrogenalis]
APHIGYEKSSKIAHKAQDTGKTVRELVLEEKLLGEDELDKILDFKKMITPGILEEDKLDEK